MTPWRRSIICFPTAWQKRNTPCRLMLTTAFQPLRLMFSTGARKLAPWLLTSTSILPNSSSVRCTTCCTWSESRTSTVRARARLPSPRIASAVGSKCSKRRLQSMTSAPARAHSMAILLPMPIPPPVTIIVLPSSEKGDWVIDEDPYKRRLPGDEKRSIVSQVETVFTEQVGDLFSITIRTQVFTFWRQGFEQMQALIVTRGAKQFTATERTLTLTHHPGAGFFRCARHP